MAMHERAFDRFLIEAGRVEFTCTTTVDDVVESSDRLWFTFSSPVTVRNDLVAIACATLCGTRFGRIRFDLALSEHALGVIAGFTDAEVTALPENDRERLLRLAREERIGHSDVVILNFSGGFDSLALSCVMPETTRLVSMDWGGGFRREREMFERFGGEIVESNLVTAGYNRLANEFMGVGAIMLSDHLDASFNAFGTILDSVASYWRPDAVDPVLDAPFDGAGLVNTAFASGLTEVATAMIIRHYRPELMADSLASLSDAGTEKLYRKWLLSKIAVERVPGPAITLPDVEPPTHPPRYGSAFLVDALALYIAKHRGWDEVHKLVTDIPTEAYGLVDRLDLAFFERLHTKFLHAVPERFRDGYLDGLALAGVTTYDDRDHAEFDEVSTFLARTRRAPDPTPEPAPPYVDPFTRAHLGFLKPVFRPAWRAFVRMRNRPRG